MTIIQIAILILVSGMAGANFGMCFMARQDYIVMLQTGKTSNSLYMFQSLCRNGKVDWEYSLVVTALAAVSITKGWVAIGVALIVLQITILYSLGLAQKINTAIEKHRDIRRNVVMG